MNLDPGRLAVGISSTALFDLTRESEIHLSQGLDAFRAYQRENQSAILKPGGAFPLIRSLLELNESPHGDVVEVVLMSKNHPDISPRILNSIEYYKLPIKIAALTGGQPIAPYLSAYGISLLLSADRTDVQKAIDAGVAAGLMYDVPPKVDVHLDEIRFAFDGDGVLFSDEADRVYYEKGLDAYFEYERANAKRPLPDGPFAPVLRLIRGLQTIRQPKTKIRVALITARNIQAHERVLRTLEGWDVRLDEAHFLGKKPKHSILSIFRPHIFFDDREEHCRAAAPKVPTAQVLLPTEPVFISTLSAEQMHLEGEPRKNRFLLVCKGFLRKDYSAGEDRLTLWYHDNLSSWPSDRADRLIEELEISVQNTPRGEQRRASGVSNDQMTKLLGFLAPLGRKYRPS